MPQREPIRLPQAVHAFTIIEPNVDQTGCGGHYSGELPKTRRKLKGFSMQTGLKKKRLALIIVFVLLGSCVTVFSADQFQQDVVVISHKWYKSPLNLTLSGPCFQPANENNAELRTHGGMRCPGNQNLDSNSESESPREKPGEQEKESAPGAPEFVYMVRIRNSGPKIIKAILWDYVFVDSQTGIELARHTFFSETELSPGKVKTLVATSTRPPTRVISVRMLIDNDSGTYGEQIAIKRIIYADGSVWEAR
jgi:hypothetical protein